MPSPLWRYRGEQAAVLGLCRGYPEAERSRKGILGLIVGQYVSWFLVTFGPDRCDSKHLDLLPTQLVSLHAAIAIIAGYFGNLRSLLVRQACEFLGMLRKLLHPDTCLW